MTQPNTVRPASGRHVAWLVTSEPVPYETACAIMQERARAVAEGTAPELVWLLQHQPLYTAGTSAQPEDLIGIPRFPVHRTGRGGQLTYHGPGQRIAYVMLDIKRRGGDVRAFVSSLEDWIVDALSALGVAAERQPGRVGVWVRRRGAGDPRGTHDKIAAIGVRLSRWVSSHGISLNVAPDLSHYAGIVPCGIRDGGVTSLADLGLNPSMEEVDLSLRSAFERHFSAATLKVDGLGAGIFDHQPEAKSASPPGGPAS